MQAIKSCPKSQGNEVKVFGWLLAWQEDMTPETEIETITKQLVEAPADGLQI